ncbi:MAG: hypothetical protein QOK35_138 [Pseudonocardiales bacterium]|nr:hypothetical protein [Pseudonocardiales bacterium]
MGFVNALTEWRAQRWLATLGNRMGNDGLLVAASVPGLGAAVDQHAAAVRDIIAQATGAEGSGTFSERALLAGYGRSLLDRFDVSVREVRRHATGRWTRADWLALRLLAVCALSRSLPDRSGTGATAGQSAPAL